MAATVTYDSATNTAKLTPSAPLDGGIDYTATLSTAVQAADGIALASAVSWSFSTAACPCQLFSPVLTPDFIGLPTQDGRTGTGPWSYELGTKITVDEPTDLNAIRFYKSDGETGTHVGRVVDQQRRAAGAGHVHGRVGVGLAAAGTCTARSRSRQGRRT